MKKILFIAFLFLACIAHAQYIPNSGAYSYKGLMPLKSLQFPTGCGLPVTSINAPDSSRSAGYFDSCNNSYYIFNPKTKVWSHSERSIDSIFITSTDSIFIVSGVDTIFIGTTDPHSYLFFDQTLGGGFYNPSGLDKTVGADTINYIATKWDLQNLGVGTGGQPSDSLATVPNFRVDSLSNTPPGSPASGHSVLVWTSTTGSFVTHENQIAEWNGSSYGYTTAHNGDIAVTNYANPPLNEIDATYQYDSINSRWNLLSYPAMHRLNRQQTALRIGTKWSYPFTFSTRNIVRDSIDKNGNWYNLKLKDSATLNPNNFLKVEPGTGKYIIDTFHQLIAGTNITIVGDTINATPGGGGGGIALTDLSATTPLLYNNSIGVFSIQQANTSQSGYLSSTDWNTFNNKQPQLNGTGFVKASGTTISYDNSTYLTGNQSITLSGDVSGSGTTAITTTIGNNKVTNAMLRQSAGLSVIGNSTNSTANVADITAGSDKTVLARNGTSIGFNTLDSTYITALHSEAYYNTKYLGNGISGTGSDNHVAIWSGTSSQVYSDSLYYDRTNGRLGIRTTAPTNALHVNGNIRGVFASGTAGTDSVLTVSGGVIKAISPTYYSTGGGGTPGGNYGNIQKNRNGVFEGDDSLTYTFANGLTVLNKAAFTARNAGTDQLVVKDSIGTGFFYVGNYPGINTYKGLWLLGSGTPSTSNYFALTNGNELDFNGPTQMNFRVNNSGNLLQFTTSLATFGIPLRLVGGTTTIAALTIPTGVLKTTPASGDIENTGNFPYYTNSVPARAIVSVLNFASKSANYSIANTDRTIEVTATGTTQTLPTAVGITGKEFTIKLTASGSCTVATTLSQTIDGSTTYSLSAQYKYVTVQSNGANWIITAQN